MGAVDWSIVIPARDEAPNVAPLCDEIAEALGRRDYEVIIVDDGSADGTFEEVRAVHRRDPRVRGVKLRRHEGKSAAYRAGIAAARGHVVLTMDSDLQDDPRDLPRLVEKLESERLDLVVGWKQRGKSSPATFLLSRLVNALIRRVTRMPLHDMNCPVRAMRREVALGLDLRADFHRYIPLLARARGHAVGEEPVANRPRRHGRSKYGGSKYFTSAVAFLGMGLFLRFGDRPMHLFGGMGLLALLAGVLVDGWVAVHFLFLGADIDDDLPTLMFGIVLILIGAQLVSLGLMAEIVVRKVTLLGAQPADEVAEVLP